MPVAASKKFRIKIKSKDINLRTIQHVKELNTSNAQLKYLNQIYQPKIFKPKLCIYLQLSQNLFSVTLTEMQMVTVKGDETDCPKFNPKTT